ncbi:MAG: DUF5336 domain-containing protein [Jatrophihabitans sp.]
MSGYGPPTTTPGPSAPGRPAQSQQQMQPILGYAAGALGILGFIWGFLDWYGNDSGGSQTITGYQSGVAAGVIGLTILAGLWAAGDGFEKKLGSLGPAAAALAALLAVFGLLVSVPDGQSAKIGLILTLITTILQAAVLIYAWLIASGKMSAPSKGASHQNQWQPAGQQGPGGYPGQHGPQGQPGGYGQPQAPQGPPPGYAQNPQHNPGQNQPSGPPPGYGQNPQQGAPQGPPPGYGQNPPQNPPPAPQQGPPPGYGQ